MKTKEAEPSKASNAKYDGYSSYAEYAQDTIVSPADRLFALMASRQKNPKKLKQSSLRSITEI